MDELTSKLFKAVSSGHYNVASTLVGQGADVNATDSDGNCPLHIFAQCGQSEGLRALISKGAKVNVKNKNGETPLHLAVQREAIDRSNFLPEQVRPPSSVRVLLDSGADTLEMDNNGEFPRDRANKFGDWRMARYLQRIMSAQEQPFGSLEESELLARRQNAETVVGLVEAELKRRQDKARRSR